MRYLDNPAGRLYDVLAKMRATAGTGPMNHEFRRIWSNALGVAHEDTTEILRRLVHVLSAPDQAKHALEVFAEEDDRDVALRWYGPVTSFFAVSLSLTQGALPAINEVNDTVMLSLEMCSHTLHRLCPDPLVSGDNLSDLGTRISELRESVAASDADPALLKFLEALCSALARGFNDYPIRGVDALYDAYDSLQGLLKRNFDLAKRAEEDHPTTWDRFKRAGGALILAVTVANSAFSLEGNVIKAIEGPAKPASSTVVVVREQPGTTDPSAIHRTGKDS